MKNKKYGEYGGQYVPETVMNAVHELEEAYKRYKNDPEFIEELKDLSLRFKGSSNQRTIDVKKSLEAGQVVLYDLSQGDYDKIQV